MAAKNTTRHPCPNCGSSNSKRIGNSWSGGLVGSVLLHECKCKDCKTDFNGKTGLEITLKERMIVIGKIFGVLTLAALAAMVAVNIYEFFL